MNIPKIDTIRLDPIANLRSLWLSDTWVTNAGLEHLKGLTSLESLVITETPVVDAGAKDLKKALPDCRISH